MRNDEKNEKVQTFELQIWLSLLFMDDSLSNDSLEHFKQ